MNALSQPSSGVKSFWAPMALILGPKVIVTTITTSTTTSIIIVIIIHANPSELAVDIFRRNCADITLPHLPLHESLLQHSADALHRTCQLRRVRAAAATNAHETLLCLIFRVLLGTCCTILYFASSTLHSSRVNRSEAKVAVTLLQ